MKNNKGNHLSRRSTHQTEQGPISLNSVSQQKLASFSDKKIDLKLELALKKELKNYLDKNICNSYVDCKNEIYDGLSEKLSVLSQEWMWIIKFWRKRLFFLDVFVGKFKIEKGQLILPSTKYSAHMDEEDKIRFNWPKILAEVYTSIVNSQDSAKVITIFKKNLSDCYESLSDEHMTKNFKKFLVNVELPKKGAVRPDSLFKYSLANFINQSLTFFDQNMIQIVVKSLFFTIKPANEVKKILQAVSQKDTINMTSLFLTTSGSVNTSFWNKKESSRVAPTIKNFQPEIFNFSIQKKNGQAIASNLCFANNYSHPSTWLIVGGLGFGIGFFWLFCLCLNYFRNKQGSYQVTVPEFEGLEEHREQKKVFSL